MVSLAVVLSTTGAMAAPDAPLYDHGSISIAADLIDLFDKTLAKNALDPGPVGKRSSGRATYRALHQHPTGSEDATITYSLKLPDKPAGAQIAFVGWSCVLDTVLKEDKNKIANGVRFMVRVNGQPLFRRDQMPGNWLPVVVPLDEHAGKTMELELVTSAIDGKTNYDWAYWGEPRVMVLPPGGPVGAEPVPGFAGLLLAPANSVGEKGVKLTLQPVNAVGAPAGEPTDLWLEPAPGSPMTAVPFDVGKGLKPEARGVRLSAEGGPLPAGLRLLPYSPVLELSDVIVARAVVTEGDELPIGVTLRNRGRASWVPTEERMSIKICADRGEGYTHQTVGNLWDRNDPNVAVVDRFDQVIAPEEEATFVRWFKAPAVGPDVAGGSCFVNASLDRVKPPVGVVTRAVRFNVSKAAQMLGDAVQPGTTVEVNARQVVLQNRGFRMVWLDRGEAEGRAPNWVGYLQRPVEGRWRTVAVCAEPLDVHIGPAERGPEEKTVVRDKTTDPARPPRKSKCKITSLTAIPQRDPKQPGVSFDLKIETPQGQTLQATLTYTLDPAEPALAVKGELTSPQGASLRRFCPVSLFVADGQPTQERGQALFPGLEYLNDGEPSSSTRDAAPPINNRLMPDPLKITVPMMAVSTKVGMVTLFWDPTQKWNGKDYGPCAVFASPNLVHKHQNHLLEIFAPSFPEYVKENERLAAKPYEMPAGSTVTVSAKVVVRPPGDAVAAMQDYFRFNPPPVPTKKRFDVQKLYEVSRHGFMKTVWYEDKHKSAHCVGWGPANAPQFGVLLWLDSILADDPSAKKASMERAHLIWNTTIREQGVAGLLSGACCHILSGEAPFYTGHIEPIIQPMIAHAAGIIQGRNPDGVWGFHPGSDAQRRALGPEGYPSQGIVAGHARVLLRTARITGNPDALAAGLKALDYHDRFRVPHGAQGWECPIYEPDVLGAAYAISAYVDAYEITGERRFLDRAIYWAWTGMAFQYVWQAPDRPPWMLYASIPVLGTTFFTHSWLGNPVQWCGLVYAYYLQKLAPHDPSFPWKRIAEGITVAGEYLQFADEKPDLKGSYPDGLYKRLTDRCPAFINPEDIILNRYAIEGHDPGIKTVFARRPGQPTIHISSCAGLGQPALVDKTLTVPLTFYKDHYSGTLVANGPKPAEVSFGQRKLPEVAAIPETPEGWTYLPATKHLIIRAMHADGEPVPLTIRSE